MGKKGKWVIVRAAAQAIIAAGTAVVSFFKSIGGGRGPSDPGPPPDDPDAGPDNPLPGGPEGEPGDQPGDETAPPPA